jgi:hypothetical protein
VGRRHGAPTQRALLKTGSDPQLGIDMQLVEARAPMANPSTASRPSAINSGCSTDAVSQEQTVPADAASDVPQMQKDLERLVTAWRAGDMRGLEKEIRVERARSPELYDELLCAESQMAAADRSTAPTMTATTRGGGHAALRGPRWPAATAETLGAQLPVVLPARTLGATN